MSLRKATTKFQMNNAKLEGTRSAQLQDMLRKNSFTDVTLITNDKEFHAHRLILSTMSPVLRKDLEAQQKNSNNVLYMKGRNSESLSALIDFIYTGESAICMNVLDDFVSLGRDLQVTGLHGSEHKSKEEGIQKNIKNYSESSAEIEENLMGNQKYLNDYVEENGLQNTNEKYDQKKSLVEYRIGNQKDKNEYTSGFETYKKNNKEYLIQKYKDNEISKEEFQLLSSYSPSVTTVNDQLDDDKDKTFTVENASDVDILFEKVNKYLVNDNCLWVCSICKYFSRSKQHVEDHIDTHFKVILQCPFCKEICRKHSIWRRHIHKFHPEYRTSRYCSNSHEEAKHYFSVKKEYFKDEKIRKIIPCQEPVQVDVPLDDDEDEMISVETVSDIGRFFDKMEKYLVNENGLWLCSKCKYFTRNKQHVEDHIETHLKVILKCPFCKDIFRRHSNWRRHIYKFHSEYKGRRKSSHDQAVNFFCKLKS